MGPIWDKKADPCIEGHDEWLHQMDYSRSICCCPNLWLFPWPFCKPVLFSKRYCMDGFVSCFPVHCSRKLRRNKVLCCSSIWRLPEQMYTCKLIFVHIYAFFGTHAPAFISKTLVGLNQSCQCGIIPEGLDGGVIDKVQKCPPVGIFLLCSWWISIQKKEQEVGNLLFFAWIS